MMMDSSSLKSEDFLQYTWTLPAEKAFKLAEQLEECALFESEDPTLWQVQLVVRACDRHALETFNDPAPVICGMAQEDWLKKSYDALRPVDAGDFYIHSRAYPPSPSHRFSLCLEAATAFGSGHHETTQGCLILIQELARKGGWGRAWDLGCGSGILTLALNALHPDSATGSDCDAEAVRVANQNAKDNQIPASFLCYEGIPPQALSCDLVVANLFAPLLKEWAPLLQGPRNLILSGILQGQAEGVIESFKPYGWQVVDAKTMGEWTSLWMERSL